MPVVSHRSKIMSFYFSVHSCWSALSYGGFFLEIILLMLQYSNHKWQDIRENSIETFPLFLSEFVIFPNIFRYSNNSLSRNKQTQTWVSLENICVDGVHIELNCTFDSFWIIIYLYRVKIAETWDTTSPLNAIINKSW